MFVIARSNDSTFSQHLAFPVSCYPLEQALAAASSPKDSSQRYEYSRTCERLVRFLLTKLGRQRFVSLGLKLGDGIAFRDAVLDVYPDKFKTYQDFLAAYTLFK